jgi:hypothetical protein
MKSEGSAADHQSTCLGVYRSVDWVNNRPVYKQEDGENYLYFNKNQKSWMVASYVGNEYAWMKYPLSDDDDHSSSSSSSSSSSDSDGEDEKRLQKKVKKAGKFSWKGAKTPDFFNQGWQYKLSALRMSDENVETWMNDDQSLRVEPLGGELYILFQLIFCKTLSTFKSSHTFKYCFIFTILFYTFIHSNFK